VFFVDELHFRLLQFKVAWNRQVVKQIGINKVFLNEEFKKNMFFNVFNLAMLSHIVTMWFNKYYWPHLVKSYISSSLGVNWKQ